MEWENMMNVRAPPINLLEREWNIEEQKQNKTEQKLNTIFWSQILKIFRRK